MLLTDFLKRCGDQLLGETPPDQTELFGKSNILIGFYSENTVKRPIEMFDFPKSSVFTKQINSVNNGAGAMQREVPMKSAMQREVPMKGAMQRGAH